MDKAGYTYIFRGCVYVTTIKEKGVMNSKECWVHKRGWEEEGKVGDAILISKNKNK